MTCAVSVAQQPGMRSPSVRFRQINTDTIRVIYPEGLEATAQRIAQVTTAMASQRPFTTGAPLRKIDLVLQNATDISNGYVGLGPWRSEFYLTPPQNSFEIGSLPWHDVLALHEFRHVQQFSAARKGISAWFYYLFGEEGYSGAVHLAVPNWFTEGDAVVAETALSAQGRGRLPAFTNGYREMVSDGDYWKYGKARNGSLKEYIPSHYPLGYLLVNYGREKYGQQFWDSIMTEAAAYKGLLYSFSGAIKRRTGLNSKAFYREAMDYYHTQWGEYSAENPPEESSQFARYRDISYPSFDTDGTLYAMVEQFDKIPTICTIDGENVTRVTSPGYQTEPVFSLGGGNLCWTEIRLHPRWYREDYSVIIVYDIKRGTKRTLTHKSSYFMPALSPDGQQIVALFDNDMQQYSLQILSSETGEVQRTLPNPENSFFTYPQWTNDGRYIISAARLPDGRMSLVGYDLETEAMTEYLPPSFTPIGRPSVTDEWIYFTMTTDGSDQIFRLHRTTKYLEQVTNGPVSKYQPAMEPGTDHLLYSGYSLKGKRLEGMHVDTASTRLVRKGEMRLHDPVLKPGDHDLLQTSVNSAFRSSRYPLLSRPVRFYSWRPYADDPLYGIELLSQNILNTLQWRSGWEYNNNSGYYGPFTELAFGLWYPEILAGYSGTRVDFTQFDGQKLIWWQHLVNAGIRIPLYKYSGPYSQYADVTARINRISTTGDQIYQFSYLSYIFQFINRRRPAYQHIESRFSQELQVRLLHTIDTSSANQFFVSSGFNIPSPVRNHIFRFEFDYRHELVSNTVHFSDVFQYAHGYDPVESDNIWRFGVRYQFPLVYPDLDIAGIVYFKRIRLSPFFDVMRANNTNYRSIGAEILFDVNAGNVEPVTAGLRWARQLDLGKQDVFSIILPANF